MNRRHKKNLKHVRKCKDIDDSNSKDKEKSSTTSNLNTGQSESNVLGSTKNIAKSDKDPCLGKSDETHIRISKNHKPQRTEKEIVKVVNCSENVDVAFDNNTTVQTAENDGFSESPRLIGKTSFRYLKLALLTEELCQRNVIFAMNEFLMTDLNPKYRLLLKADADAPSHLIIFSVRFLHNNMFQVIGGVFVYENYDVTYVVAQCVKAFINDLSKIGFFVVGSVSPPTSTFKKVLQHLCQITDINSHCNIFSYSVHPFEQIIHIYDAYFVIKNFLNLFRKSTVYFEDRGQPYYALWKDIMIVLNTFSNLNYMLPYFEDNDTEVPRRVHIFSQEVITGLLIAEQNGILSVDGEGSMLLLQTIQVFVEIFSFKTVQIRTFISKLSAICIDIFKEMKFDTQRKRLITNPFEQKENRTETTNNESQYCDKDTNNNKGFHNFDAQIENPTDFLKMLNNSNSIDEMGKYTFNDIMHLVADLEELNNEDYTMQERYQSNPASNDLTCTILGTQKLLEIMMSKNIQQIRPNCLNLDHLDFFQAEIKKRNEVKNWKPYEGFSYTYFDKRVSFLAMDKHDSLHTIKKN